MPERDWLHSGANIARQGLPECIDIKEAVYLRMAPEDVRDVFSMPGAVGEDLNEFALFSRFFPSIREEAVFWYRAGRGRGVILWTEDVMQFVPDALINEVLRSTR